MNPIKNKIKSAIKGDLKNFLKQYQYEENLTDFQTFYKKYQHKKIKNVLLHDLFINLKSREWILGYVITGLIVCAGLSVYLNIIRPLSYNSFIITSISGEVNTGKENSKQWKTARLKSILRKGTDIQTGPESECEIQLINKAVVRLEASSQLNIKQLDNKSEYINSILNLIKGEIILKPKKLKANESFIVTTPSVIASVTGTKFDVKTDDAGNTEVSVDEGRVVVRPNINTNIAGKLDNKTYQLISNDLINPVEIVPGERAEIKISDIHAANKIIKEITDKKIEFTNITISPIIKKSDITVETKEKLDSLKSENILNNTSGLADLYINSDPQGAEVYVNQSFIGLTPIQIAYANGKFITVKIYKKGFSDYIQTGIDTSKKLTINAILKEIPSQMQLYKATNSTFIKSKEVITEPGDLIWEKPVKLNMIEKEVIIFSNKVIISDGNKLILFDTTGIPAKIITVKDEKSSLTKPVTNRTVSGQLFICVGSDTGGLFAYSPEGDLLWKNPEAGQEKFNACPSIFDDILAVPTLDKGIQIFDSTGTLLNSIVFSKGEAIYSSPLIIKKGQRIIYGTETGNIGAYDLKSNKTLWVTNISAERIIYPIMGDDKIAIALSTDGKLTALDPENGEVLWTQIFHEISKTTINPIYSSDKLICSANTASNSVFLIINAINGNMIHKETIPAEISQPYIFNDNLIFGTPTGMIYNYNISSKEFVWNYNINKQVYLVTSDRYAVYGLTQNTIIKIKK